VLRAKLWTGKVTSFPAVPLTLCSSEHQQVAYQAAKESIVLVKNNAIPANNNKPLLPIDKNGTAKIAITGPYADQVLTGPAGPVTSSYVIPCVGDRHTPLDEITAKYGPSKIVADWHNADIVIVVVSTPTVGTNAANEGTDRVDATLPMSEPLSDPKAAGTTIPSTDQNALVSSIIAAGKKTIVVLEGGCAVVKGAWFDAPSVIVAFFAGQRVGMALADIIFGDVNPSGKLSVTFPVKEADLPEFTNDKYYVTYEQPGVGRGYPYYLYSKIQPLLPFGFGMSYTTFAYSNPVIPANAAIGSKIRVSVDVTNSGTVAGDEIVQLYLSQKTPAASRSIKQLRGFARASLAPGATKTVTFNLKEWDFAHWNSAAGWVVDPGTYEISIAKNSMDANALVGTMTLE
jgi:hypothetical protein